MTAKHTSPGDASFRTSLLRTAGGAVGLVAAVALAFGLLGALGSETDQPVVAEAPDEDEEVDAQAAAPEDDPDEPAADADDPDEGDIGDEADDEDGAEEPEPGDESPEPDAETDEGAEDPDEAADADEPAQDEAEQDEPSASAEPEAERQFAPDSVTVQVLDGYQADGGTAASSVAATLRDQGYSVMAQNPARRYDVTTVLFTPGFEPQARQVAADLGAAEVRQQPGNLSEGVQVHVVVGADRG